MNRKRWRIHYLDRIPWWLWWLTDAVEWVTCRLLGHEPMENFNYRVGSYWMCATCTRELPEPTTTP